ncbi:hypothetical protein DXH78_09900 [Undibacter mobilis]|uniref:Uncharacterized protein n=2 Tax=Undibacter mobilis TaxID=2292256 RepID=A0A371BB87_9BRAD|nr:hypothetical protein DXH78_09900 [Undibacter mobilis]
MGCSDLSFGIALSLFFGTIVAVPVISYLILADAMAGLARAPWSLLIYAAFVIVGCALYLAAWRYGKGEQLPANAEEWHRFWRGHGPVLIIAAIPFVRRLWQVTSGSR